MADNLTTTTTLATIPNATTIRTLESSAGHIQIVLVGGAGTCTTTSVGDSASSATLLSSNADRVGATLYNDSPSACYVKMGTTASATDFNVKMSPGGYYEVPFGYTGRIDAIWVTDAGGSMRIGELT